MLNKKSLFHFVYAIALVGAIISCVGILNEFLNIVQLYGVYISGTITVKYQNYFEPLCFYLAAFIISAFSVFLLLRQLFGKSKINKTFANVMIAMACTILLIMSFAFLFVLKGEGSYVRERLEYFNYLHYYTFRSGVMSFVANMGIILVCNRLDAKYKKKQAIEPREDAE